MSVVRELVTRIKFSVDRSSISNAQQSAENLKRSLRSVGQSMQRFGSEFKSGFVQGFSNEWRRQAQALDSQVQAANRASRSMSRLQSASSGVTSAIRPLIGMLSTAFSVHAIKAAADEMMNLDGRLRTVTASDEERYAIEKKLYKIAQNNRQDIASIGDLYYKVARSSEQFSVSQEDVLRVTDVVAKALTVGGASAQEARSSILQLGQALGSGRLQGDELRSLDENASLLMKHVASHFGTTVGGLKELGRQGLLTSEELIKAILKSGAAIDKEFAKMPMTIGQSLEVISNGFNQFILRLEQKTHIFEGIARSIVAAFNSIEQSIENSGDSSLDMFGSVFEQIRPTIEPALAFITSAFEFLKEVSTSFMQSFSEQMAVLEPIWTQAMEKIAEGLGKAAWIIEKLTPLAKTLAEVIGSGLANAITTAGNVAATVFQTMLDLIADLIHAADTLANGFREVISFIGLGQAAQAEMAGGWQYGSAEVNIENNFSNVPPDQQGQVAADAAGGITWDAAFD